MKPHTAAETEVPSKDLYFLMSVLAGLTGKEVDRISPVEFILLEGFPDVDIIGEIDVREGVLVISLDMKPLATFRYEGKRDEEGEIFLSVEEGRWAIRDIAPSLALLHKLTEVCRPLLADHVL